ncbi:hypothetical protein MBLNU230_g1943t1 [Neophaeotheca triangularis]
MAERGQFRGGRGDRGGRGRGGGGRGGRGGGAAGEASERPTKQPIMDLEKFMNQELLIKFSGGRQVTGILKGYDTLMSLVLDDTKEMLQDDEGNTTTRRLGLLVVRGTMLTLIAPTKNYHPIKNPFAQDDDDEEGEE